jgi:hypothetical protein
MELSHVLRVLYLQVVQIFQDHWLTWCDCLMAAGARVCTTRLARVISGEYRQF